MVDGFFQIVIEKLDKKNFQMRKKIKIINFLMGKVYWDFIIDETRIYSPRKSYNVKNSS
jgi:hypothetical protein